MICPGTAPPVECDNPGCRHGGCQGRRPVDRYISSNVYDGVRPVSPAHAERLRKLLRGPLSRVLP